MMWAFCYFYYENVLKDSITIVLAAESFVYSVFVYSAGFPRVSVWLHQKQIASFVFSSSLLSVPLIDVISQVTSGRLKATCRPPGGLQAFGWTRSVYNDCLQLPTVCSCRISGQRTGWRLWVLWPVGCTGRGMRYWHHRTATCHQLLFESKALL